MNEKRNIAKKEAHKLLEFFNDPNPNRKKLN
jgi:hypothetical protein